MTYNAQDVKQTNDMQTMVRCNHVQSTTYQFFFRTKRTNKNKQTNKQTECFSIPPNLNYTFSLMCSIEIHY
jgi:hypothetical protein